MLASHGDELRQKWPGVVGYGIGATKHSGPVNPKRKAFIIVVYLKSPLDAPSAPQALDGIPIRFVVTGVVRAQ